MLVRLVGGAAAGADFPDESLGEDALERGGDQERLDAHIDKARDGPGRVVRVQGGENQVAGQRSLDRNLRGFDVAGLADENPVRILPEKCAEHAGECQPDPLVDRHLDDAVDLVFHRVLGCQELGINRVDLSQAGIKGRGFSRAGRAGDDENPVRFLQDLEDVVVDVFRHPESLQIEIHARAVENAQHHALAEYGGKSGNTKIHLPAADRPLDPPILGQTALGDVEVRHHLHARDHREREVERRRIHLVERPVHAVADFKLGLERLEMDVARPGGDRLVEDQVHVFDDRAGIRLRRDGLQVEAVATALRDNEIRPGTELRDDVVEIGDLRTVVLADEFGDAGRESDHHLDLAAESKSQILDRLRVERVHEGDDDRVPRAHDRHGTVETGETGGDKAEHGCIGGKFLKVIGLRPDGIGHHPDKPLLVHHEGVDQQLLDRLFLPCGLFDEVLSQLRREDPALHKDVRDLSCVHTVSPDQSWWW